jgi:hypothetical protein
MATYIDATAAGAFVDDTVNLARYAGASGATPYYIVCTDSAGKTATGYLGAAGAGPTEVEVLTDGGLENWTTATNATIWTETTAGGSTVNQETVNMRTGAACARLDIDASNSAATIYQSKSITPGSLCRLTVWYNVATGKTVCFRFRDSPAHVYLNTSGVWQAGSALHTLPSTDGAWAQYVIYFNAHPDYTNYFFQLQNLSAASSSIYFDDISLVQITDPDSTGLHVYDDANSSTRGWKEQEAGFDPILISSYAIYSTIPNIAAITPSGGIANVITV